MKKYAAILLNLSEPEDGQILHIVTDENSEPIYFKNEETATAYIKKSYSEYCIFFGLLDDPKPYHRRLKKQLFKGKKK